MRKLFFKGRLFLFLAILVLIFTGCEKPDEKFSVGFVYPGFVESNQFSRALDNARKVIEAREIKTYCEENVPESAECERVLLKLINKGCKIIYAGSFGFQSSVERIAPLYPDVKFCHCSGTIQGENVSSFFGRMYEARYLCGIVAGMKTKTNKVGFVAAKPVSECIRGINAFYLGMRSVNKNASLEVVWTHTWNDFTVEVDAANILIEKGCDVLAQHQDSHGCMLAAEKAGVYCIGFAVSGEDVAPGAYLTAPVFKWKNYIIGDIEKYKLGKWEGRFYWGGLREGTVDIDYLTTLCAEGTFEKVEEAKRKIINGELKIFSGPLYDQKRNLVVKEGDVMSDSEVWNMDWLILGINGRLPAKE